MRLWPRGRVSLWVKLDQDVSSSASLGCISAQEGSCPLVPESSPGPAGADHVHQFCGNTLSGLEAALPSETHLGSGSFRQNTQVWAALLESGAIIQAHYLGRAGSSGCHFWSHMDQRYGPGSALGEGLLLCCLVFFYHESG